MLLVSEGFTSSGTLRSPAGALWLRPSPPPPGRGPGGSWVPLGGATLTHLFLCSGSHGQFKRPERSFALETEEPTGALSPLAPGESDQCPRQGPCRLQPGYDQPGLFQGKKLAGVACGQTDRWAGPLPTPTTNPQIQARLWLYSSEQSHRRQTERQTNHVAGAVDKRTDREKKATVITSLGALLLTAIIHTYTRTLMPKTEAVQNAPHLDFIPNVPYRCFNPHPLWHCEGGGRLLGGRERERERYKEWQ